MPSDAPHSLRHAAITNALDEVYHCETLRSWARHADPRTTEHYDRARGNLDRHGIHFLAAYVAGVQATARVCSPTMTHSLRRLWTRQRRQFASVASAFGVEGHAQVRRVKRWECCGLLEECPAPGWDTRFRRGHW